MDNAQEIAAIVAWMRERAIEAISLPRKPSAPEDEWNRKVLALAVNIEMLADAIEAGDYLTPPTRQGEER